MSFFDSLLKKLEEETGGGKTMRFGDMDMLKGQRQIHMQMPALEYKLRSLGIPKGIVEIRGESQSGKTSFALQMIKCLQQQFGDEACPVILSSERRDNKSYAKKIGVDVSKVLVQKIVTIEDLGNKIHQIVINGTKAQELDFRSQLKSEGIKVDSDEFKEKMSILKRDKRLRFLFVWDSLGNTISAQEKRKMEKRADEDTDGQAAIGSAARSIHATFRSLIALTDEYDLTLLIINRPYDKVDGTPGVKSYGGKGVELYPTMRLHLKRLSGLKVGEKEVGQNTEFLVVKSDYASPKQRFSVELLYGIGFIFSQDDIDLAVKHKLLEKNGHGYKTANGKLSWASKKELYQLYSTSPQSPFLRLLINNLQKILTEKLLVEREGD